MSVKSESSRQMQINEKPIYIWMNKMILLLNNYACVVPLNEEPGNVMQFLYIYANSVSNEIILLKLHKHKMKHVDDIFSISLE